jgi:hypothetical protein
MPESESLVLPMALRWDFFSFTNQGVEKIQEGPQLGRHEMPGGMIHVKGE